MDAVILVIFFTKAKYVKELYFFKNIPNQGRLHKILRTSWTLQKPSNLKFNII